MSTKSVHFSPATPASPPKRRVTSHGDARVPLPSVGPILETAARRGAARWRATVPGAADDTDVDELLALLATTVQGQLESSVASINERIRSPLGERLVGLLRTELLRSWSESETEGSAMRALLLALEEVREAIEPPWAALASRLSGADGLELAVDIAHDLRSPLTSVLFLAETLQREQSGSLNELQQRQLRLISCAALGLTAVTNDIIDIARGGGHLVEGEPVPFSVIGMLDALRDIVRPIADAKRLAVQLEPPSHDQRLGHPVALSRVLLNLTTNALKFTEEGYVEIVAREAGSEQIEFAVRDSGKGIDPAIVNTLYRPVRRVSGRTGPRFSSTGLGLAICQRLVREMGGELAVETHRGWGTRFFFLLRLPPYGVGSGTGAGTMSPAC